MREGDDPLGEHSLFSADIHKIGIISLLGDGTLKNRVGDKKEDEQQSKRIEMLFGQRVR